jgi:hypothetical protein
MATTETPPQVADAVAHRALPKRALQDLAGTAQRRTGGDEALWCIVVYTCDMATTGKPIRQSVSLPAHTARQVRGLARTRRMSASRVLVDLIESGLEAKEKEKRYYLGLLEQLRRSKDPADQERLTAELARLTFGE